MAAGVNVALCPLLVYRSYICPVREPRHFTPAKPTGDGRFQPVFLRTCSSSSSPALASGPPPIVSRKLTFNCFLPDWTICARVRVCMCGGAESMILLILAVLSSFFLREVSLPGVPLSHPPVDALLQIIRL